MIGTCSLCNKENIYLFGFYCKSCYSKKYANFYNSNVLERKLNPKHIQQNIWTSREKICIICGKTFFTEGRINHGKTCSLKCRKRHIQLYSLSKASDRKEYQRTHLKERQVREKNRLQNDAVYKIAKILRSNLRSNLLLRGFVSKNSKFSGLVNYTYADLRVHLEKQFTPLMSWDNYGSYWSLDHIVPLSWYKTKEQLIKHGYALKNLQPLENELNFSKQNFYCGNPKTGLEVIYL